MDIAPAPDGQTWRGDAILAVAIVAILGGMWAAQDWHALSALRLADTDDAMRLLQVRDWLGGQAWSDLTQYRLGPPGGLAMHWSRLPDLPIAAIVLAPRPLVGTATAELIAVLAWPPLLFAAQLMLIAAIARRLGGAGAAPTAMLVAALAYPAISQFMPGRIDHHGLQIVLLTACAHGMIAPASKWRGLAIGAAMFASIATGLEMAPLLAVIGGWAAVEWLRGGGGERLAGIGAGLAIAGVLGAGLIPASGPGDLCDALNAPLRVLVIAGGIGTLLLATFADRLPVPRWAPAAALAAALALLGLRLAPACLAGPYGAVDPMLERLWLANVAEAHPLFATPFAFALGYAGLMAAGLAATLWQARRAGGAWWGLAALIAAALAVTCLQVRGAYPGAALAAPGLAMLIARARAKGVAALAGAWIVSAGILYPIAGAALTKPPEAPLLTGADCTGPEQLAALAQLPPGRIVAPIDIGAFALPATRHASLSAPYHRNNAGNAAMYRFFLGPEHEARAIARRHDLTYVAWCDGAFGEIDLAREAAPGALAPRLAARRPPAWLVPVRDEGLKVWRIADEDADR
ncbi:hypothetical protein D1610_01010 [Sphingomonas gilva]|uniref:AcrB/AcrD/AcrF family protein n=1 Tax=Sphingomonas gilva TaxID=2305907 RepID=A0A396RQW4_9SPHN|nr:hypothetical protein [Sphingomonas gilva]RHW18769.1 hypothetical protein D1610_01010 [Sphingomonas gilva]